MSESGGIVNFSRTFDVLVRNLDRIKDQEKGLIGGRDQRSV